MTKGRRGFEKFVELLEYRCPHVYREVAKREPRDPPAGFPRNRFSDRLRIINDLPHLLEQIKDSLTDSSDLEVKLCTLHGLLEDAKDENLALEKEVETLKNVRIELDQLRHTNTAQEKQVSDLTKEVTSWMHKAYTHSEKENELRDSNQELRIQCDELQRKLRELGTVEKPVERSPIPRNPSIELSQFEQRRVIHMNEERLILREELENYKEQCQELNQRLDTAQREDFDLREQLSKQEHEMHILQKQNKILKKKHKEEDAIVIQQFEQIQKKGQEILELEAQCIKDRSRVCELQTEKNMWIEEQHLLRQEIRHLRNELDSLRCLIRSSGSSQTGTTSEEEDCIEADKKRKLFARRKPVQKDYKGEKYAEVITRQKLTKAQNRMERIPSENTEDIYKASTLPSLARETTEDIFRKECALFRYTRRNNGKPEKSQSMKTELSVSMVGDSRCPPDLEPIAHGSEARMFGLTDNFPNRNADNPDDDVGSGSTNLVARAPMNYPQPPTVSEVPRRDSSDNQRSKEFGRPLAAVYKAAGMVEEVIGNRISGSDSEQEGFMEAMASQSEIQHDFSCHEVIDSLLPKKITLSPSFPTKTFLDTNQDLKYPVLGDKIEIRGGNHTGIFISKVIAVKDSKVIAEGDKIIAIKYSSAGMGRKGQVCAELQGLCLDFVHRLLSEETIQKRKNKTVTLKLQKAQQEYNKACEWMENNGGHGDFFYVRCNNPVGSAEGGTDSGVCSLNPGDIFLVTVTHPGVEHQGKERYWGGHKIDPASGRYLHEGLQWIPDYFKSEYGRLQRLNSGEEGSKISRSPGVKLKGKAYEYVLPMKACVCLPVYLVCPDDNLAVAIMRHLSLTFPQSDFIIDMQSASGLESHYEKGIQREDKHYVCRCNAEQVKSSQQDRSSQRILLLVTITQEMSAQDMRDRYGNGFHFELTSTSVNRTDKQKLQLSGQYFGDEICIPDLSSLDQLTAQFISCVTSAQNRIMWLRESEMDPSVAANYRPFLIKNLAAIQAQVQEAMSFEKSSELSS